MAVCAIVTPIFYPFVFTRKTRKDRCFFLLKNCNTLFESAFSAIIELKPGTTCTEEDINAFCEALPRYKRPRRVIFATVPRNPTGKIEKPVLRERYGSGRLVEAQITG